MLIIKNRRNFLKDVIHGTAGVSSLAFLSACSSFDTYLFEDRYDFKEEVMIVGGGISGLYLAYKLRNNKTEFRLFEGSHSFGGRIKSSAGSDYGASLLSVNDKQAKLLLSDLSLQTKTLDKDFLYLAEGLQALPEALIERIIGLIPYRNFRLRWRLVGLHKQGSGFELLFEHPRGQKRFKCKKIALAIPPTQWSSVAGLMDLPEMKEASRWLETLSVENTVKIILPGSAAANLTKPLVQLSFDEVSIRQIVKKNKITPTLEIEVSYPQKEQRSIDSIYYLIRKKLQINYPFEKLTTEQYYDWQQVKLIRGAKFKNFMALPESSLNNNFQIVGDFTPSPSMYSIEGALYSAKRASELLL